ncbi:MAG: PEGA domain-containing protein [Acidobacteria bacterium]|nr:PEGA domain-containing protein [Acidobacteriota bacterium]
MTRRSLRPLRIGAAIPAALAAVLLAAPPAAAQRRNPATSGQSDRTRPAAPSGERAVPRGEARPPAPRDSGSEQSTPSADRGGRSAERNGARTPQGGDQPGSRDRNGRPVVGEAVPRTTPPPRQPDTTTVILPGYGYGGYGYGGYGYGGYGYGGYGYGGYYDPYGPGRRYRSPWFYDEGQLRLKVKPTWAEVYIDGYYAGVVDEFDGFFQRLRLDAGPHQIEIRAGGYETLTLDVRIDPGRTTTYEGRLREVPAP